MVNSPGSPPATSGAVAVTCSECGQPTTVPFTPTPGRPVYCRECFQKRQPARPTGGYDARTPAPGGQRPGGYGPPRFRDSAPSGRAASNTRKRMLAQGRKGHFMYDAKEILKAKPGGMDEQHHRAFLEGLFARGARGSTEDAQIFLDEKLADETISKEERDGLGRLLERYSFWR